MSPETCLVIVLYEWLLHHDDSLDDCCVDEVEILDAIRVIPHLLQEVRLIVSVRAFLGAFETLADMRVDGCVKAAHQVVQESGFRARFRMVEQAELVLVDS